MISTLPIEPLVTAVFNALDDQLALLELKRQQLRQLLPAIARQDNQAMESSLAQMEQAQLQQEHADQELERHIGALAAALALPGKRPRLSELAAHLGQEQAQVLIDRKAALVEGLRGLRRQHMEMSMLLHECQKINRLLIEGLLSEAPATVTYGADGVVCRRQGGSISAEL